MRYSTSLLVALGVNGAFAVPHLNHKKFHENKRAVGDLVVVTMDGQVVSWTNEYAGPAATPAAAPVANVAPAAPAAAPATVTPSPAASGPSSGVSSGNVLTSFKGFCTGNSNGKRATNEEIAYAGNDGSLNGCAWGSNFYQIAENLMSQYDYTVKFTASGSEDQQCICTNKIGKDNGIDGLWFAALDFSVPAGQSAVVAAAPGTIGQCACGAGSVPKSPSGQYAGSLLEFDFADSKNNNWNGADASALVAGANGMPFQGMHVSQAGAIAETSWFLANAKLSDPKGSTWDNSYVPGTEAVDGSGLNIPAGPVSLNVILNYTG